MTEMSLGLCCQNGCSHLQPVSVFGLNATAENPWSLKYDFGNGNSIHTAFSERALFPQANPKSVKLFRSSCWKLKSFEQNLNKLTATQIFSKCECLRFISTEWTSQILGGLEDETVANAKGDFSTYSLQLGMVKNP